MLLERGLQYIDTYFNRLAVACTAGLILVATTEYRPALFYDIFFTDPSCQLLLFASLARSTTDSFPQIVVLVPSYADRFVDSYPC